MPWWRLRRARLVGAELAEAAPADTVHDQRVAVSLGKPWLAEELAQPLPLPVAKPLEFLTNVAVVRDERREKSVSE